MRIVLIAAWAMVSAVAACSSEPSSGTPGANGGTGGTAGSGGSAGSVSDAGAEGDGSAATGGAGGSGGDVGIDANDASSISCDDKAKACASEFGSLFTKSNGRADGSLVAIVRPVDQQCAMPNATHVTLQLSILGQVQRLVVSVEDVAVASVQKPLLGPPYAEGWHVDQQLEYATDLGVHSDDFTQVTLPQAVEFICSHLEIGAPVSVFAYSDGSKPSSAHQIHSNDNYPDGAIVANPTSASPTYLLFRYANQVF